MFHLSGWLVLAYMVLYEPNFSLMFSIHLFLYAGVYCTIIPKNVWINSNIKTLSLGGWASTNRFKPAQTSIQNKPVCCFVRTKICIQNIKTVETSAKAYIKLFPWCTANNHWREQFQKDAGFAVSGFIGFMWTETPFM